MPTAFWSWRRGLARHSATRSGETLGEEDWRGAWRRGLARRTKRDSLLTCVLLQLGEGGWCTPQLCQYSHSQSLQPFTKGGSTTPPSCIHRGGGGSTTPLSFRQTNRGGSTTPPPQLPTIRREGSTTPYSSSRSKSFFRFWRD